MHLSCLTTEGRNGLVNGLFHFHPLCLQNIMSQDGVVVCHSSSTLDMIIYKCYVAKVVFFRGSDCQGKKDPGRKKIFQQQRDPGAILLAFKLSTVGCQAHISQQFMEVLTDFL